MDIAQDRDSEHDSVSAPSPRSIQKETCVQYKVSSEKNGTVGERNLILNIHFQRADYPSVFSGKSPLFSYVIKKARLELSLKSIEMGIEDVVPVDKFQIMTEHAVKSTNADELSMKGGGEINHGEKGLGGKASLEMAMKNAKSSERALKTIRSSIEYKHLSNRLMHWLFSPNDGREYLSATLFEQPLGTLKGCGKESLAHSSIMVLERDVEAKAPDHLKNMGMIGFVTFKLQRAAIVKEMNHGSIQQVSL